MTSIRIQASALAVLAISVFAGCGGGDSAWKKYDVSNLTTAVLMDVWAAASDDVWAVGDDGTVLHFDGAAWSAQTNPAGERSVLAAVWGASRTDVWAVGSDTIIHWNGSAWSVTAHPEVGDLGLSDVHGSGPDDVWAVGKGGILHWTGDAWTVSATEPQNRSNKAVFALSPTAVYAASAGTISRWTGSEWKLELSGPIGAFNGIWGFSTNDIWLVGDQLRLSHYHGSSSEEYEITPDHGDEFYDVWGAAPDDVWAVAEQGQMAHWDGSEWSEQKSGTTAYLTGVHGTSANDVWAVGGHIDRSADFVSEPVILRLQK